MIIVEYAVKPLSVSEGIKELFYLNLKVGQTQMKSLLNVFFFFLLIYFILDFFSTIQKYSFQTPI